MDHPINIELIQQAESLAKLTGENQATPYGESCLQQGLAMAEILNSLHVDSETLAASIVYSSAQYADLSLEDIEEHLGSNVTKLINLTKQLDGISELYEAVAHHEHHHPKIDNIRKMLLAMVDDVRAVLIKLAERLCVLRSAKILSEQSKQQLAQETMAIYAPLANRLGIWHIKWELEDLAFRYLEPQKYQEISKALSERRIDRDKYVEQMISSLTTLLEKAGVSNIEVTGRAKHIYSIYRKMQRKNIDFNEIYDATALRVIVPTIEDCYTVLSNVHATWQHIAKEFDDYIATPKANGYKSIHSAIIGPGNKSVEVQIRTFKMHEESELGVAAHWVYKEGPQKSSDYEAKIAWLRQVMDWQQEVTQTEDSLDEVHNIFADRVYVFTPNNDIIDLPRGASVLDFAYHVHSEVGHRCRGAKVNNSIVNLTYQLKTGESVEILTRKQPSPSRDWLNPHLGFVKTARAKAKINSWFRKQEDDKSLKIKSSIEVIKPVEKIVPKIPIISKKPTNIEIQGVDNLLTHIANCCQPIPGDTIIGYITQGRGISIHREDCFNIVRIKKAKSERLVEVNWGTMANNRYPVNLIIEAYNRHNLIKDISNIIANENISLMGLNANVSKKDNIAYINLTVEIESLSSLDNIIMKIKQLSNVLKIKRD